MMAEKEYIEREAALLEIEEWAKTSCEFDYMWPLVFNSIRKIPTADVRPVVKAHWTDRRTIEHDGEWYCSACGKEITIYMGADRKDRYKFCPNCGAKMEES